MCREVELDYVDRGEGVCYRLLRSVSCLQQLHHPNIVPLVLINLEQQHNTLRLFYEDAGLPLEDLEFLLGHFYGSAWSRYRDEGLADTACKMLCAPTLKLSMRMTAGLVFP